MKNECLEVVLSPQGEVVARCNGASGHSGAHWSEPHLHRGSSIHPAFAMGPEVEGLLTWQTAREKSDGPTEAWITQLESGAGLDLLRHLETVHLTPTQADRILFAVRTAIGERIKRACECRGAR